MMQNGQNTSNCRKCARPLIEVLALANCVKPGCMWDFSPVVQCTEFVALPAPEYQPSKPS